jgi:hypothetical protein
MAKDTQAVDLLRKRIREVSDKPELCIILSLYNVVTAEDEGLPKTLKSHVEELIISAANSRAGRPPGAFDLVSISPGRAYVSKFTGHGTSNLFVIGTPAALRIWQLIQDFVHDPLSFFLPFGFRIERLTANQLLPLALYTYTDTPESELVPYSGKRLRKLFTHEVIQKPAYQVTKYLGIGDRTSESASVPFVKDRRQNSDKCFKEEGDDEPISLDFEVLIFDLSVAAMAAIDITTPAIIQDKYRAYWHKWLDDNWESCVIDRKLLETVKPWCGDPIIDELEPSDKEIFLRERWFFWSQGKKDWKNAGVALHGNRLWEIGARVVLQLWKQRPDKKNFDKETFREVNAAWMEECTFAYRATEKWADKYADRVGINSKKTTT